MPEQVKSRVNQFGWANIITIIVVLGSALFNYATMTAKVENIDRQLTEEIVERKLEDQRIVEQLSECYKLNTDQHQQILNELSLMRSDLSYHLGYHKAKDEPLKVK